MLYDAESKISAALKRPPFSMPLSKPTAPLSSWPPPGPVLPPALQLRCGARCPGSSLPTAPWFGGICAPRTVPGVNEKANAAGRGRKLNNNHGKAPSGPAPFPGQSAPHAAAAAAPCGTSCFRGMSGALLQSALITFSACSRTPGAFTVFTLAGTARPHTTQPATPTRTPLRASPPVPAAPPGRSRGRPRAGPALRARPSRAGAVPAEPPRRRGRARPLWAPRP